MPEHRGRSTTPLPPKEGVDDDVGIMIDDDNDDEPAMTAAAAAVKAALASDTATVIVSKCESGNIKVPVIDKDPVMIKERFMASVAG